MQAARNARIPTTDFLIASWDSLQPLALRESSLLISSCVAPDHVRKQPSSQTVRTVCPAASKRALITLAGCSSDGSSGFPVSAAHNRIRWSRQTVSARETSGLNCMASKLEAARTLAAPRVLVAAATATVEGVAAPTADEMASELAVSAIWGLALAGKPEAEAAIKVLKASPAALRAARGMTEEAMKTSKAIQSMGQQNYYKEMKWRGESKSHWSASLARHHSRSILAGSVPSTGVRDQRHEPAGPCC